MQGRNARRGALVTWLCGAAAALTAACGGGTAVSSTTTAHQRPIEAPTGEAAAVQQATAEAPLPRPDDPKERLVYLRSGAIVLAEPRAGATAVPERVGPRDATAPALSPHGDAVAFAAAPPGGGPSRVHVLALGGDGTARAVTDGAGGGDFAPAWAPDGRTLVFARGGRGDLYVLDFDKGGAPRRLVEGKDAISGHVAAPAWSPDGTWIVFSADRGEGEGAGLWRVAPDGTGLSRLTRPGRSAAWVRDERPSFSPDGRTLVFASNRDARGEDAADDLDIYALDVASGAIARLTRDPGRADDPCYSPDGKRVYFTSTRDARRSFEVELYAMPAGGGEQLRMTRDESPQNTAPSAARVH